MIQYIFFVYKVIRYYFFIWKDISKDIDARYFGNKARFINHSRTDANCESRIIMS